MVLDTTSATSIATKLERPDSSVFANEPERVRPVRPETGETSDAGPAVVVTLSAAARETARPVNEGQQAADEARARDAAQERSLDRDVYDGGNATRPWEASRPRLDLVV